MDECKAALTEAQGDGEKATPAAQARARQGDQEVDAATDDGHVGHYIHPAARSASSSK